MAWTRFRQGNFIALESDDNDEPEVDQRSVEYY